METSVIELYTSAGCKQSGNPISFLFLQIHNLVWVPRIWTLLLFLHSGQTSQGHWSFTNCSPNWVMAFNRKWRECTIVLPIVSNRPDKLENMQVLQMMEYLTRTPSSPQLVCLKSTCKQRIYSQKTEVEAIFPLKLNSFRI